MIILDPLSYLRSAILFLFVFLCLACPGFAADPVREVTLQWDKSIDDPYIKWYRVYYSRTSGGHASTLSEGHAISYRRQGGSEFPIAGEGGSTFIQIPKDETQITLIFSPDNSNDYYFVVTSVEERETGGVILEGIPTPEISITRMTVSKAGTGTGTVKDNRPSLGVKSDIDCGTACLSPDWADYTGGTTVTLTAAADPDNTFVGWSGVGGCSGTGPCVVTVSPALNVTATFMPIRRLDVVKAGVMEAGTVTALPTGIDSAIDCGTGCSSDGADFIINTAVTLTAAASTGYTFTGWTGGYVGTGLQCVVNMSAAKSVTAEFKPLRRLSVVKAGAGKGTITGSKPGVNSAIDCGTGCASDLADYAEQSDVSEAVILTATADTGHTFMGWSGGGCSGTGQCSVTMNAAKSVTANFVPFLKLSVTKTGAGTGTVSGSPPGINCGTVCMADYSFNTAVTLTAASDPGNNFAGWSGGECSGTGPCIVSMSAAKSAAATFAKKGDVNLDGAVNIADVILILQAMSRTGTLPFGNSYIADVNNDGKLGLEDAIYILQKAAGLR